MIDLRSDTVTRPSAAMKAAMVAAELGDDVWGDDPTVNHLQAVMAARTGMQAALFFPTGTQSNLAALMAHCARGDEYIVGQLAHTYKYEGGGAAVLGSIQPQPLENAADGSIPLDKIEAAIKPLDDHFARSRLLALENTIGGKVLPAAYVQAAQALARSKSLALHLDGARVANAAVAQGISLQQACAGFDTVSICLSKGLGAPAGAVLCGSAELVGRAHRWRKVLGGGMRQSGMLAAAGLYALEHNLVRLAEDHANAATLAAGLAKIEQLEIVSVATNMLFVKVPAAACAALEAHFQAHGILSQIGPVSRFVTHLDVSAEDIATVVAACQAFFADPAAMQGSTAGTARYA
jgi:threonine aldolase